ncbi:MAG: PilZ domain-containing protein [Desulfobacteraceae bacterium]|nr:PilZ domain-containing protein [Desulfobacteraceae bacterium]
MVKKSLKNQVVENRLSTRKKLQTMVKIVNKNNESIEESANYSISGLFFKCDSPDQYDLNDKVEISFIDKNGIAQHHTGKIVRITEEGVAVHYLKDTKY